MLSEYDFSDVSFVFNRGTCIQCGIEFKDGFVYKEGEICGPCKDILIGLDIDDDDYIDWLIDQAEEEEKEEREFAEMFPNVDGNIW